MGENVVVGMRAVSKVFIGDMIEAARRVQTEWIGKTGDDQITLPSPPRSGASSPSGHGNQMAAAVGPADGDVAGSAEDAAGGETQARSELSDRRGPLLPEHLREAYRRYKTTLEGHGVGMNALWNEQNQNGAERFAVRTGGRRIFR